MMVRRSCSFVFIVLAIVASTACVTRMVPQTVPVYYEEYQSEQQEETQPRFNPPPPVPVIPSCWDPRVGTNQDGIQYQEWFDNSGANTPTWFKITDRASGKVVCFGVVRPGARQFGPAIWAHKTANTEWVVTGTSYVTVVNSTRTEGVVDERPVRLEYVRNYGWYTRCPC